MYYSSPDGLRLQTEPNLKLKLRDLIEDGEVVAVSDPAFTIDFNYRIQLT